MEFLLSLLGLHFFCLYPFIPKNSPKDNILGNIDYIGDIDYIISFSNLMYLARVTFSSINSGVVNIDSKT